MQYGYYLRVKKNTIENQWKEEYKIKVGSMQNIMEVVFRKIHVMKLITWLLLKQNAREITNLNHCMKEKLIQTTLMNIISLCII